MLVRLVEDRPLLHHDGFFLFLACELREGGMWPEAIARLVLAEAG